MSIKPKPSPAGKLLVLLLFVVLYFVFRMPFYSIGIGDIRVSSRAEEGMFAAIMVYRPLGQDCILYGRIDENNLYTVARHPLINYEPLKTVGLFCSKFIQEPACFNDQVIAPRLRFIFSSFQFLVWLTLLLILLYRHSQPPSKLLLLLIAAVMISPIAIKTSYQLQIDGSTGVLMHGVLALAVLLLVHRKKLSNALRFTVFSGTAFLALGKQEWSISLLAALAGWLIYLLTVRRKTGENIKPYIQTLLLILAGLVLGNIISYLAGPKSYIGGFEVMRDFSKLSVLRSAGSPFGRWLNLTYARLPWICTVMGIIAVLVVLGFVNRRKPCPYQILLCLFGLAVFGMYFVSLWNSEPRYFVPSLVVLTIACAGLWPSHIQFKPGIIIILIIFMMFITTCGFVFYRARRIIASAGANNAKAKKLAVEHSKLYQLPVSKAWNKPEINFLSPYVWSKKSEELAQEYGKELVEGY